MAPSDRTHDTSSAKYHIKDLATFGQHLTDAVATAFPRDPHRYKEVYVLLLSWEDDNLGVLEEVSELKGVFDNLYHYQTEEWRIPRDRSHTKLVRRLATFVDDYESKDNLLIVYYGGHAVMNEERHCVFTCTDTPDSPSIPWYGVQTTLEQSTSDVLILLDCCAAGSSSTLEAGNGVTELIAACGFEDKAPGVGEHSFTRALTDELKHCCRRLPPTAAVLHNLVLARIKSRNPRFEPAIEDGYRKTPIYIQLGNKNRKRSIELMPLNPRPSRPGEFHGQPPSVTPPEHPGDPGMPAELPSRASPISIDALIDSPSESISSSQTSLSRIWPDEEFRNPKVLITVALEDDQWLQTARWREWIEGVPAATRLVHVEGVFKSDSTLLLVSLPVAVWDLLPKNPAITFLAFVKSRNLCVPEGWLRQPILEAKREDRRLRIPDDRYFSSIKLEESRRYEATSRETRSQDRRDTRNADSRSPSPGKGQHDPFNKKRRTTDKDTVLRATDPSPHTDRSSFLMPQW